MMTRRPHPVVLAIEASQRGGGVALRTPDGGAQAELFVEAKRHDDDLLPAIDRLFTRAGLTPAALSAVAVSIGPGGFTGLRIATATAKALAETTGCALVAVPSALVAAEACAEQRPILVLLASKRDNAWCTQCARDANGRWMIEGTPGLCDASALALHGIARVLADEHLPMSMRTVIDQAGIAIEPPMFTPSDLLLVGERMLARGEKIDALQFLPLYPREPEAVKVWRERGASRRG